MKGEAQTAATDSTHLGLSLASATLVREQRSACARKDLPE
jgi:hypothetical protein